MSCRLYPYATYLYIYIYIYSIDKMKKRCSIAGVRPISIYLFIYYTVKVFLLPMVSKLFTSTQTDHLEKKKKKISFLSH